MYCEKGACSSDCTKKVVDLFPEDVPRELAKYENLHGEDVFDANKRKVARTAQEYPAGVSNLLWMMKDMNLTFSMMKKLPSQLRVQETSPDARCYYY